MASPAARAQRPAITFTRKLSCWIPRSARPDFINRIFSCCLTLFPCVEVNGERQPGRRRSSRSANVWSRKSRTDSAADRHVRTAELQMLLNDLAQNYSHSIVKHAYVNLKSIMRVAEKLKFIADNPADDTRMPETKAVDRPTMTAGQIIQLVDALEEPHDLCLMSIDLFCATRTSETLGPQGISYAGDRLIIHSTAYEGGLYDGRSRRRRAGSRYQFRRTFARSSRCGGTCVRIHHPRHSCFQPMAGDRVREFAVGRAYPDKPRIF